MATDDSARREREIERLAPIVAAATERWKAREDQVEKNRRDFQRGITPDTKERQKKAQEHRIKRAAKVAMANDPQLGRDLAQLADIGKERILQGINDLVSIEFLEQGIEAAMPVGRVENGPFTGTGFLVGHDIMLTNNHVLPSELETHMAEFHLDAEENRIGDAKAMQCFKLRPDTFFVTCEPLDFTFVAVEPLSASGARLDAYGWHPLVVGEGKIKLGEGVSIIQHPGGQVKMVALHNSRLIELHNEGDGHEFCFYTCDTDRGSSGSPVFSTRWEVIALHHASVPETNGKGKVLTKSGTQRARKEMTYEEALENPDAVAWVANEGIRVSRLVSAFSDLNDIKPAFVELRQKLLELWQRSDVVAISRPKTATARNRGAGHDPAFESARSGIAGPGSIEVPITLSIRLGAC